MRRFAFVAAAWAATLLIGGVVPAAAADWSPVLTKTNPAARGGHSAAYDPVSGKIVLFGGTNKSGFLADTWTFDGASWTKLATRTSPPKRADAGMAYDEVSRQLVLFGGFDGVNHLGDTWLFDGATGKWTQAAPHSSPRPASGGISFTDPLTGHATMFGGVVPAIFTNDTWQWSGADWVRLDPPNGRGAATAASDPAGHNAMLFAGESEVDVHDTGTWDGPDGTLAVPASQPDDRSGAAAAFDPGSSRVILFGGFADRYLNDTWTWDGWGWTPVSTRKAPLPRELHSMVYFPPTARIVLFGGFTGRRYLPDTWTYGN
jgi:hypothetical protein